MNLPLTDALGCLLPSIGLLWVAMDAHGLPVEVFDSPWFSYEPSLAPLQASTVDIHGFSVRPRWASMGLPGRLWPTINLSLACNCVRWGPLVFRGRLWATIGHSRALI